LQGKDLFNIFIWCDFKFIIIISKLHKTTSISSSIY